MIPSVAPALTDYSHVTWWQRSKASLLSDKANSISTRLPPRDLKSAAWGRAHEKGRLVSQPPPQGHLRCCFLKTRLGRSSYRGRRRSEEEERHGDTVDFPAHERHFLSTYLAQHHAITTITAAAFIPEQRWAPTHSLLPTPPLLIGPLCAPRDALRARAPRLARTTWRSRCARIA